MKTLHLAIIVILLVTVGISSIAFGQYATKGSNFSTSYLNVTFASVAMAYSGNNITETIEYHIMIEPKLAGQLTVNIFKNNQFIKTDTLSDRDIVSLATGGSYYFYQPTLIGKKDQDVYRLEFKYDGQNVEKIIPITSSSNGIINTPKTESPLKQFKSGVKVQDVKCQPYYFILIIKSEDGSPACVTANTAFGLAGIGWGYLSSPITSKIDLLDSKITGEQSLDSIMIHNLQVLS